MVTLCTSNGGWRNSPLCLSVSAGRAEAMRQPGDQPPEDSLSEAAALSSVILWGTLPGDIGLARLQ